LKKRSPIEAPLAVVVAVAVVIAISALEKAQPH